MASQSGEHNELNFTGESAEEAEDFVQAINRRAYAAGRHKDSTWIAEFAYSCFSRKALRWYETLDEETRSDWQLLRRAILAEFTASPPGPATVPSAAPALVSSPSSPTPAAPPPPVVTVKMGHIRVDAEDHTKRGYFSMDTSDRGAVAADSSKATIFEVDTLARTLRFKGSGESLDIRGESPSWSLTPLTTERHMYGLMVKSSAGSTPQWNHTWSITEDGNVMAMLLRTDGSQCDATFNVHRSTPNHVILVSADKEGFLAQYGKTWTRATLHLEPLS